MRPILTTLLFLLSSTITNAQQQATIETFATYLTGHFSSQKQSVEDTAYYHISLHMTRIWDERTDGIWLYVKQAMASRADKPYRQRVYQLGQKDTNLFTSEIYTIKNAAAVVGSLSRALPQPSHRRWPMPLSCDPKRLHSSRRWRAGPWAAWAGQCPHWRAEALPAASQQRV